MKNTRGLIAGAILFAVIVMVAAFILKPKPSEPFAPGTCLHITGQWGDFIFKIDRVDDQARAYIGAVVGDKRPSTEFFRSENGVFTARDQQHSLMVPQSLLKSYRELDATQCP